MSDSLSDTFRAAQCRAALCSHDFMSVEKQVDPGQHPA